MKYILGFDIDGAKSATLLTRPGRGDVESLEKKAIPIYGTWKGVLGCLADEGKAFLESHQISGKECCASISHGGPLDSKRGVASSPPNLLGWDQVPIVSYLEQHLDMDARLKNDTNACILVEQWYRAGRGYRHMTFLTFKIGLGAGLALGGRLYEGVCGMAGEAGHVRLAKEGPVGYKKAGNFRGSYSGEETVRLAGSMVEDALKTGRPVSCTKEEGLGDTTARSATKTTETECTDAKEVLAASGWYFGRGPAMLMDILSPERIVAGGIYTRVGRSLKSEMERELRREALSANINTCRILPCGLGEQIGDYGAVMAALEMWEG